MTSTALVALPLLLLLLAAAAAAVAGDGRQTLHDAVRCCCWCSELPQATQEEAYLLPQRQMWVDDRQGRRHFHYCHCCCCGFEKTHRAQLVHSDDCAVSDRDAVGTSVVNDADADGHVADAAADSADAVDSTAAAAVGDVGDVGDVVDGTRARMGTATVRASKAPVDAAMLLLLKSQVGQVAVR